MAKKNRYLFRNSKKRQNRFSVILITIVLIMIIILLLVSRYNISQKQAEYAKREAKLQEQIEDEQKRADEIAEYEKYTKTKKYAEEVAKEKLGLVNENEIIFKEE